MLSTYISCMRSTKRSKSNSHSFFPIHKWIIPYFSIVNVLTYFPSTAPSLAFSSLFCHAEKGGLCCKIIYHEISTELLSPSRVVHQQKRKCGGGSLFLGGYLCFLTHISTRIYTRRNMINHRQNKWTEAVCVRSSTCGTCSRAVIMPEEKKKEYKVSPILHWCFGYTYFFLLLRYLYEEKKTRHNRKRLTFFVSMY